VQGPHCPAERSRAGSRLNRREEFRGDEVYGEKTGLGLAPRFLTAVQHMLHDRFAGAVSGMMPHAGGMIVMDRLHPV
jgi:hypothetical protein